MTKLIVLFYSIIIEILLLTGLVAGMIAAYSFIPDAFFQNDLYQSKDALKVIIGFFATFTLEVLFFGPALLLWDMQRSLRSIESGGRFHNI